MRNQTFIKLVLKLVTGICLLAAVVNYVVDPYGKNNLFEAGFNKIKIIKDERISKYELLDIYPKADSFIFGSSRGLILNPLVVERIAGGEALNLSFSSATADEYLLYVRYLVETRKVRNVIIGIDLFAYADGFDSTGTLPQELRNYYGLDSNYSIANYFSLKMFRRSIKAVRYNLSHDGPEIDDRYTDKGQIMIREYLDARKSDALFRNYIGQKVVNKPARWATRFNSLDKNRLESLKEIKRLCQDNGVNLYLFTSPLYIRQITMKESKFPLQLSLLQYIARNIHPVTDYNPVGSINESATNYIDEFHYSYDMADSILTQLLTGKPLAGELAGVYVDRENIDEYVEQVNRQYMSKVQSRAPSVAQ